MGEIVIIADGESRVTTLAIAEGMDVEYKAVIQLVRNYQSDLEEFGLVPFEMRPRPKGQHGGSDVEYAALNEQQSTLIMTYMKNTEIARTFKKRLVKAFFELAQRPALNPVNLTRLPKICEKPRRSGRGWMSKNSLWFLEQISV